MKISKGWGVQWIMKIKKAGVWLGRGLVGHDKGFGIFFSEVQWHQKRNTPDFLETESVLAWKTPASVKSRTHPFVHILCSWFPDSSMRMK